MYVKSEVLFIKRDMRKKAEIIECIYEETFYGNQNATYH